MHILIKISFFLLKLIPSNILVGFVNFILLLKNYRKQVINNNYKFTIGQNLSISELNSFYRKCIHNIARVLVETICFNSKNTSKLVYSNINALEQRCVEKNGLILMASHYGNWELACINLPNNTTLPCYGVYKPLKNKSIDKALLRLRSSMGLKLIPMNSIARSISENNAKGIPAIYILIADQNPRSVSSVVWKDFLGIKTAFSNGLEKFHNRYKMAFAYMKITPENPLFNYTIDIEFPDGSDRSDPLQWYSNQVEKQILAKPEYWLWSHKRWKRKFSPK